MNEEQIKAWENYKRSVELLHEKADAQQQLLNDLLEKLKAANREAEGWHKVASGLIVMLHNEVSAKAELRKKYGLKIKGELDETDMEIIKLIIAGKTQKQIFNLFERKHYKITLRTIKNRYRKYKTLSGIGDFLQAAQDINSMITR